MKADWPHYTLAIWDYTPTSHDTPISLTLQFMKINLKVFFLWGVLKVKILGSEKGSFRKGHLLEILEILESPQTVKNKGESEHFLEILEDLEI